MKWTKEQQEAIELREKNILVSAAAGSGKTAVLVERIKQLIIKDEIPLNRMLIVTFSNAAASEMKEKIVTAITKEIETQENENSSTRLPGKVSFLKDQLNQIHKANISTFHAFSMEVIRRYFYLIDIEPNFKICDEAQKAILQAEAMEELFETLFEARDEIFLNILNKYATTKSDDAVKGMILETHNFIQSIPDSFGWLQAQVKAQGDSIEEFYKGPVFQEIKEEIKRSLCLVYNIFSKVKEMLELQGISSLVLKCEKDLDAIEEMMNAFKAMELALESEENTRSSEGQSESFEALSCLISGFRAETFRVPKEEKEDYEEIKEAVKAYRDRGKDILNKLKNTYLVKPMDEFVQELQDTYEDARGLEKLVREFDKIYKEKKQKKGLIDFNDIEHYALDILAHEEAAKEYREKFDAIFIDEYQDSNIVQETLINKIKRDNNVFMVGDVKQSIYKFRLAEPEIFISKYEAFKENKSSCDQKIDLNRNFRSKGQIITAINDIFSQIMKKDISGLEYDDAAALYKGDSYEGDLDYPVELHLVDDMQLEDEDIDEEIMEMKKAEVEAYAAAQLIKEAKGSLIYDSKKQISRSLTNKDVVILLRGAKGTADIYYEALMREGIPAFVDNSDGYFDTLEIEVFLNLLRVIDNKKQDIPLLSILRSAIFGFKVEELIEIRLENRKGAFHKAFEAYAEAGESEEGSSDCKGGLYNENRSLRNKCRCALEQLATWKRESTFIPLEDFLWKLIYDTGYYEYIGAIPGGVQRQANLRALVDKAVQFQKSQMKGLFQFINYIEAIKKRKVPMGQVKLLGENDDVVRIMTIHKSKGLEFPMVLVGGLGKRFNKDRATYRVSLHKDIGLGMRYVDREHFSYKKTITQMVIEGRKDREGLAEELRILYVAFTRAKDKLMLLGTVTNIDDLYEMRKSYEMLAVRWAIERITKSEFEKLEEAFEFMEFYTQKKDIEKMLNINQSFHELIYNASKNKMLAKILSMFQMYIKQSRSKRSYAEDYLDVVLAEHREIFQAFIDKDVEAGVAATAAHLENARLRAYNK
jgi:ATP-dependent helicase/nuclease subunit A